MSFNIIEVKLAYDDKNPYIVCHDSTNFQSNISTPPLLLCEESILWGFFVSLLLCTKQGKEALDNNAYEEWEKYYIKCLRKRNGNRKKDSKGK